MWKVKIRIAGMPQYVSTLISVQIFYDFCMRGGTGVSMGSRPAGVLSGLHK